MSGTNNSCLPVTAQELIHTADGVRQDQIPLFDRLFANHPETRTLVPETYQRQPVARTVIRKGDRQHHVGLFSSRLNKALVPFESTLEKQACSIFESWSNINGYISQPYAINLEYGGTRHKVYPDFELTTNDTLVLVDVKFASKAREQAFLERADALTRYADQRGMAYHVLTEQEIWGRRLENAHWLLSLARGKALPELIESTWQWLSSQRGRTLGEIFRATSAYPQVQCVIASLALDGHLDINWDAPISEQPVLLLVAEED